MMRIGGRAPDTTEQEVALAKATQRLDYAEEKRSATRRWLRDLPEAIREFEGQATPFRNVVEADLPRMTAFLDLKMDLLEAYTMQNPNVEIRNPKETEKAKHEK